MANTRENGRHIHGKLNKKIGNKGEDVAVKFLENKGFVVISRNYQKAWGEIDIIATKDKTIHFFEVKSVTFDFSRFSSGHKPEDNVTNQKIGHIRRMVQTFYYERSLSCETPFEFHVLSVYLNYEKKMGSVRWIENIIL